MFHYFILQYDSEVEKHQTSTIHTHKHRHTHIYILHTHTDRQTDRQTHTHTHTHTPLLFREGLNCTTLVSSHQFYYCSYHFTLEMKKLSLRELIDTKVI